jgi:dTDP-4-amino-4,6-dideoxygalactose transaminase
MTGARMSGGSRAAVDELAIFGGEPVFSQPRHVGRPNIGDRDRILSLVSDVLDSRWLTNNGPRVVELERRVADLCGAEHCVVVCNATTGLQLGATALGMSGEVLMPAFTFVGTAHALSFIGASPVFCEVDPRTHCLDPDAVLAALTPHTTGIVGVHLWGRSGHAEALERIARSNGVPLMFDAAHALGCTTGLGSLEVVSLHATKVANAGEGGAMLTADSDLASRLRLMRNFGFVGLDTVNTLGTNAKMSEISAAVGLGTLESFDAFVEVNRRHHRRYTRQLGAVPGLTMVRYADHHNFHYVVIEVPAEVREDLLEVLWAENVFARRYFHPGCHRHPPYRDAGCHLPLTDELCSRVVTLPTGTAMSEQDVDRVCALIRNVISHAPEIRRRLQTGSPA